MFKGDGELAFSGFTGPVGYEIPLKAVAKRSIPAGYRGALTLSPETARALFHASYATLRLGDGKSCRLVVLGHSEGSHTAYFQTIG